MAVSPGISMRRLRDKCAEGMTPAYRTKLCSIWVRQGRCCIYCGQPATEVDHVVPLARGGSNYEGNLAPSCRRCNQSKNAKFVSEWRHGRFAGKQRRPAFWIPRPPEPKLPPWPTEKQVRAAARALNIDLTPYDYSTDPMGLLKAPRYDL